MPVQRHGSVHDVMSPDNRVDVVVGTLDTSTRGNVLQQQIESLTFNQLNNRRMVGCSVLPYGTIDVKLGQTVLDDVARANFISVEVEVLLALAVHSCFKNGIAMHVVPRHQLLLEEDGPGQVPTFAAAHGLAEVVEGKLDNFVAILVCRVEKDILGFNLPEW